MKPTLNISKDETLPIEFLSLRNVVYGGSGAGKTAFGRVIFEESIKVGIPCGVIDLKADWWGLKSSADGKSDGIPVVIFGGEHADVPINENGGAELAEIVAELRQPFIIDLEEFSKGKQLKFLAPFFDRLYDKNRHPLKLICDESDRYIPQRILTKDPNAAICLGAGEDIAKRGRKHGIFAMFISQRNADLNKSVTELCDVAVVFRTSGPNDQKAVDDWFNAKGSLVTEEQRAEVMQDIAGLRNGESFFCCAHPHLKMFKKIQLRMPETFDSSATPEIGKELMQPKKFAKLDLEKISDRMKATIEEAKAKDPAQLHRVIAQLKKDLATAQLQTKKQEVFSFSDADWEKINRAAKLFEVLNSDGDKRMEEVREIYKELNGLAARVATATSMIRQSTALPQRARESARVGLTVTRVPAVRRTVPQRDAGLHHKITGGGENGGPPQGVGKCERAILTALAQYPDGRTAVQVALLSEYSVNSGGFNNSLGKLRSFGFITREQPIRITDTGLEALGDFTPLPTGIELAEHWISKLGKCEASILKFLVDNHPNTFTSQEVGDAAGYSPSSGGFNNSLGRLRTLELITRGQPMKATDEFFQ